SRRRHTRFSRDWSSDVCSSDLKISQTELSETLNTSSNEILTDSTNIANIPWKNVFADVTLTSLIDTVLSNNLDLKQTIHRIEVAQSNFKFKKSALYPTLEAAVETGIRKYGHYTESGIGNYDSNFSENLKSDEKIPDPFIPDYFVGVRSSWEIDLWGKLRNNKEAAFLQLISTNEIKRLLETELVTSLASSYYELVSLDEKIKVYDQSIKLHERALEIVEAQKEAGRADELAVQQFKAILSQSKANKVLAEQMILAYEHQMNSLMGRVYQPIIRNSQS